jgi:hypothetical protein
VQLLLFNPIAVFTLYHVTTAEDEDVGIAAASLMARESCGLRTAMYCLLKEISEVGKSI